MLGRSKPVTKHGALAEAEPLAHVLARLRVGGGGAGDERHAGEQPAQLPELHVLGPEVVAPLADAVRLVDGEEGDAAGCATAGRGQPRLIAAISCRRSRNDSVMSVSGAT